MRQGSFENGLVLECVLLRGLGSELVDGRSRQITESETCHLSTSDGQAASLARTRQRYHLFGHADTSAGAFGGQPYSR